jgi:hypothetical protein
MKILESLKKDFLGIFKSGEKTLKSLSLSSPLDYLRTEIQWKDSFSRTLRHKSFLVLSCLEDSVPLSLHEWKYFVTRGGLSLYLLRRSSSPLDYLRT